MAGNPNNKTLQGQELLAYLASNPNSEYDLIDGGSGAIYAQNQQKRNMLEGLLKGIADPFTRIGASLGEASIQQGMADNGQSVESYTPRYMSDQDYQNYQNPWNVIKDLGSVGSTVLPFGGGFKAALAAGGLAGFGGSYGDESIGGTISNTLMGGLGGGVTHGAIKLGGAALNKTGNKFSNMGTDLATQGNAGLGRFTQKLDLESEIPIYQQFDQAVTGATPEGQNWLQKTGRTGQFKDLGLITQPGDLDYVNKFSNRANKLDQALTFFDLPRDHNGLSELASNLGNIKNEAISSADNIFQIGTNTIADPETIAEIARNSTKTLGLQDIEAAFRDRIMKTLPEGTKNGRNLSKLMEGSFEVKPFQLEEIKRATAKAADRVYKKGSGGMSVDDLVDAKIHDWSKTQLESIPGVAESNRMFNTLFENNAGFRQAYDTGLRGTRIASPQDAKSRAIGWIFNKGNKLMEGIGNKVNGGSFISPEVLSKIRDNRLMRSVGAGANIASKVIRPIAGSSRVQGFVGNQIMNGQGGDSGQAGLPNYDTNMLGFDPASLGYPADPTVAPGMSGFNPYGNSQGEGPRIQMVQQLLSQGYKPSDVKTLVELFDPSGGKNQKLDAAGSKQLRDAQNGLIQLQKLQTELANASGTGPILGRIASLNPFDSDTQSLDSMTSIVGKQIAKGVEGGKMTDADARFYESKLPTRNDTKATAAKKINYLVGMLEDQIGVIQGEAEGSGGFNPYRQTAMNY